MAKGKVSWQAAGRVNLTRLFGLGLYLCAWEDTFTEAVWGGADLDESVFFPAMEPEAKLWLFMAQFHEWPRFPLSIVLS